MNPLLFIQLLSPLLAGLVQSPPAASKAEPGEQATTGINPAVLAAILTAAQRPVEPAPPVVIAPAPMPVAAAVIAVVTVVGFFVLLSVALFGRLLGLDPAALEALSFANGLLGAGVVTILAFYFGSSLGSWSKNGPLAGRPAPADGPIVLPVPTPTPAPQPAPTPTPAAGPPAPFDAAPPWFKWALHEVGTHEDAGNTGAAVSRYCALAHAGAQGDPWCAIFANAALEVSGITGTRSASSQSFRSSPDFVQLPGPVLGALAVFWRGSKSSGLGHVGFYRGEDATRIWVLGGNESDMVQIEALPIDSASFGLIGYWWPISVPLPPMAPVTMPSGSAASIQIDPTKVVTSPSASGGRQTGITATMFASPSDLETSAYTGQLIQPSTTGVALPFRWQGDRPRVRVFNPRANLQIDTEIVDVGPWNTNDPYWVTGTRPQAESGTDMRGRKTNKAGIDLTMGAAQALQIDGKGLVDWEFLTPPAPPQVT